MIREQGYNVSPLTSLLAGSFYLLIVFRYTIFCPRNTLQKISVVPERLLLASIEAFTYHILDISVPYKIYSQYALYFRKWKLYILRYTL